MLGICNQQENTNFNDPSEMVDEKNFVKSIATYCGVSQAKLNGILLTLKDQYMELLQD